MIAIEEMVLFGILKDNTNPDEATNSNDESGRYRMPILRQWETDGDVPTQVRIRREANGTVTLIDRQGPFLNTTPDVARELLLEEIA